MRVPFQTAQLQDTRLIHELEQLASSAPNIWEQLAHWSERVWAQNTSPNLHFLIRELIFFVRTYQAHGQTMCSKQYQRDRETVQSGLTLADPLCHTTNPKEKVVSK